MLARRRVADAVRARRVPTRATTMRDARRSPPGRRAGGGGGRARLGRHRHPGRDLPRHRPGQERELHLAERTAARTATSRRRLGRPVRLANDANCFALSEATDGAAARARASCSASIVGTGTGGGVVVDGRVLTGAERHRRRMGPQPAALAGGRETAGPPVLLRPARAASRLFLSGPGPEPRPPRADGRGPGPPRTSPRAPRAGDAACEDVAARATRRAWRARWPRSSTSSIPT